VIPVGRDRRQSGKHIVAGRRRSLDLLHRVGNDRGRQAGQLQIATIPLPIKVDR
jgi:hypothetical protein